MNQLNNKQNEMTMEKKSFFTKEFYENPNLTLDVLNKLVDGGHVADQDWYQSGTFLFMEVFENDETKEILSQVISNLPAYKRYNAEGFVSDEETEIGLCALQHEHNKFFGGDKEIKWDFDSRQYAFEENVE